ncbi:hypothetical protein Calag_0869 [Caldisphaera lagunensis DSM 15908]|uniref:Glycosyl transferase family 28 C-terminal domain-containing protein n=1 Tax=Caldisphaera lagunensis (strain DSM 15908 / JCM 11604 / ANMR 0165 / IC-154) TaxID=1056495 RepID=L0AB27_CALLD|nr:hypothetical protein [Caldisphaera lagunensis]AFZ70609.1 hypothetical protein Calag_0869 [Caldisphaera lagunensis DSM 15908]
MVEMKILYASSSVGLGHITRDYHIKKRLNGEVIWLTAGNALKYIKEKGENFEEVSNKLLSLGDYIEKMIKNCKVRISISNSYQLYKAVKHNSELIKKEINFNDYDLIIADEFWEFMFINIPKERSVFLTDFTKVTMNNSYIEKLIIPRLNSGLISRINEKFALKINLSLWDKDDNFINLGPVFTDNYLENDYKENDNILINVGGTNAALKIAEKIKDKLNDKYDVKIIGSSKYFNPDPKKTIKEAGILISLSGYGSIIESNLFKKRTIFLYIENHFEHIENANIIKGRKGFRVYPCNEILNINIKNEIEKLKKEEVDSLKLNDSTNMVVEEIEKLIR